MRGCVICLWLHCLFVGIMFCVCYVGWWLFLAIPLVFIAFVASVVVVFYCLLWISVAGWCLCVCRLFLFCGVGGLVWCGLLGFLV